MCILPRKDSRRYKILPGMWEESAVRGKACTQRGIPINRARFIKSSVAVGILVVFLSGLSIRTGF